MGLNQSMRDLQAWRHTAKKSNVRPALHQQGWKIIDVDITNKVGVFFDIDPDEVGFRMLGCKRREAGSVFAADIAPCRAQAGDKKPIALQPCF